MTLRFKVRCPGGVVHHSITFVYYLVHAPEFFVNNVQDIAVTRPSTEVQNGSEIHPNCRYTPITVSCVILGFGGLFQPRLAAS